VIASLEWLIGQVDNSLTDTITDVNLPAVGLLATSGVIGLIFIVRWMIKFQREFTNFYIDENNKLRLRIDDLEKEAIAKDDKISAAGRELLKYERESDTRIRACEKTIDLHEITIADMQRRLGE